MACGMAAAIWEAEQSAKPSGVSAAMAAACAWMAPAWRTSVMISVGDGEEAVAESWAMTAPRIPERTSPEPGVAVKECPALKE